MRLVATNITVCQVINLCGKHRIYYIIITIGIMYIYIYYDIIYLYIFYIILYYSQYPINYLSLERYEQVSGIINMQ